MARENKALPPSLSEPLRWLPRPQGVDVLIIVSLVFLFTGKWISSGLPGGDFPGNVAWIWHLKGSLEQLAAIPSWSSLWFCGSSYVLIASKLLCFLLPLPFSFLTNIATATKLTLIVFHILAGIAMYYFARYLTEDRDAALVASIAYCLHPLYIMETALHGHLEVSFFYFFLPLMFGLYAHCLRKGRRQDIILAAVAFFMGFWVDNEGFVVTLPFLLLFGLWEGFKGEGLVRSGLSMRLLWQRLWPPLRLTVITGAIAMGLGAYFIIPALLETRYHTLFFEDELMENIHLFALSNFLYPIDRAGALLKGMEKLLPGPKIALRGLLYLGIVPLITVVTAFLIRKRSRAKEGYFTFFLLVSLGSMWLAMGPYSLWDTFWPVIKALALSPHYYVEAALSLSIIVLLTAGMVYSIVKTGWLRFDGSGRDLLRMGSIVALVMLVFFGRPFMVLRKLIPLYSHMRAPYWFYISFPVLGLSMATAFSVLVLKRRLPSQRGQTIALLVLIGAILVDYSPYRKPFSDQVHPQQVNDLKGIFSYIGDDQDYFRTLGLESYKPLMDMGVIYSAKPTAWAWLNWDSPKYTGEYIYKQTYPRLWNEGGREEGLILAGIANIKYLVDDLAEEPNLGETDNFPKVAQGGGFVLYKNPHWRPYVQIYSRRALYVGQGPNLFSLLVFLNKSDIAAVNISPEEIYAYSDETLQSFDYIFWDTERDEEELDRLRSLMPGRVFDVTSVMEFNAAKGKALHAEVKWQREVPQRIDVEVNNAQPALLMISESHYPGWRVRVDGQQKKPLRVNYAFQGVDLTAGQHRLSFVYQKPFYFALSAWLSAITWLSIGVIAMVLIARHIFALTSRKA